MKKVCVPRFAENAKYESSAGVRQMCWRRARGGVSARMMGRTDCRMIYLHLGSVEASTSD
jgi:hypothetical protein